MARTLLRAAGLPSSAPPDLDDATRAAYERFTAAHIDRNGADVPTSTPPGPLAEYVLWLAAERDVLFHGSPRGDLTELRTERESRDAGEFGDRTAVYASDAPLWAMFFAVLVRDGAYRSTRNRSVAVVDDRRRYYLLTVNDEVPPGGERGPGWLYILPRSGFVPEPPLGGVLDCAQWISQTPVRPITRFAVSADDLPLRIGRYARGESMLTTIRRQRYR